MSLCTMESRDMRKCAKGESESMHVSLETSPVMNQFPPCTANVGCKT